MNPESTINSLLSTELFDGMTLGDILSFDWLMAALGNLVAAVVIIFLAFWVSGWIKRRILRLAERNKHVDKTLFTFLGSIVRYAIIVLAGVFILQRFGFQTTSLVALIGAAGLAVGLALQGTLSDMAAGVMMVFFRPIRVGDFVSVDGEMGTVNGISLVATELATVSNVQVLIPNSKVWSNTITNYSVYDKRRAEWVFGVGYGADLKLAETIIIDTIMADDRSMSDPEPFIQVNNLGDFSVDFLVRVWVPASEYFAYQADMKRKVKEALDAGGIDIPFPTRTVLTAEA
jgi:small conductance mechanosensitive channel